MSGDWFPALPVGEVDGLDDKQVEDVDEDEEDEIEVVIFVSLSSLTSSLMSLSREDLGLAQYRSTRLSVAVATRVLRMMYSKEDEYAERLQ